MMRITLDLLDIISRTSHFYDPDITHPVCLGITP